MNHGRKRLNGFTLIELLVVILIIGLLIGILVPALSKSREVARTMACSSGMRQWGIASGCYQTDFGTYLPKCGEYSQSIQTTTLPYPAPTVSPTVTVYAGGANTPPGDAATGGARLSGGWYNALPSYINVQRYGEVYAGGTFTGGTATAANGYALDEYGNQILPDGTSQASLTGADAGFNANWIWYCPAEVDRRKKTGLISGAGTNGGSYSMNRNLGYYPGPFNNQKSVIGYNGVGTPSQLRNKVEKIPKPDRTPFLVESGNNPSCSVCSFNSSGQASITSGSGNMFRFRHYTTASTATQETRGDNGTNTTGVSNAKQLYSGGSNILLSDGHVGYYEGRKVEYPGVTSEITQNLVFNTTDYSAGLPLYEQTDFYELQWGCFSN